MGGLMDDSCVNFRTLNNHQKWQKCGKKWRKSLIQKLTDESSVKLSRQVNSALICKKNTRKRILNKNFSLVYRKIRATSHFLLHIIVKKIHSSLLKSSSAYFFSNEKNPRIYFSRQNVIIENKHVYKKIRLFKIFWGTVHLGLAYDGVHVPRDLYYYMHTQLPTA